MRVAFLLAVQSGVPKGHRIEEEKGTNDVPFDCQCHLVGVLANAGGGSLQSQSFPTT